MFSRDTIVEGRHALGLWLVLDGSISAEVAGCAGIEWVIIDCQHGIASLAHIQLIAQTLAQFPEIGIFVRIPGLNGDFIQQILDIGVTGIIVPNVKTVEEVNAAVRLSRYPPTGSRSISAAMIRATRYGFSGSYLKRANDLVMVVVQIETKEALHNLPEIARIDGVSGIFPGPKDLAASMGYTETSCQPVVDAIYKIEEIGKEKGLLLVGGASSPADIHILKERGYRMITIGSDVSILASSVQRLIRES